MILQPTSACCVRGRGVIGVHATQPAFRAWSFGRHGVITVCFGFVESGMGNVVRTDVGYIPSL